MINQIWIFGKAIKPLFADRVTSDAYSTKLCKNRFCTLMQFQWSAVLWPLPGKSMDNQSKYTHWHANDVLYVHRAAILMVINENETSVFELGMFELEMAIEWVIRSNHYPLNSEIIHLLHGMVPLPLRLEMKGLVCLASRTCADGMWYYIIITTKIKFIFLCFHC